MTTRRGSLFLVMVGLVLAAVQAVTTPRALAAIQPLAMQKHRLAGNFHRYSNLPAGYHSRSRRPMAAQLGEYKSYLT